MDCIDQYIILYTTFEAAKCIVYIQISGSQIHDFSKGVSNKLR